MLRLSVLLCAVLFVTLLVAGEDRGQMRPGLAAALEAGEEIRLIERRLSDPVALAAARGEPAAEGALAAPAPAPVAEAPAPEPVATLAVAAASEAPPAAPAAARRVIPEPVFTLSALPSLGGDQARIEDETAEAEAEAPPQAGTEGGVWYVDAGSVNVRQGPSTETSVVGKLSAGEAVTVIAQADADWVQIVIEGDGLEGYVAARFLSPTAP